jgi:hypothetical protein
VLKRVAQQVGDDLSESGRIPIAGEVAARVKVQRALTGESRGIPGNHFTTELCRSHGSRFSGMALPSHVEAKSVRSLINFSIASNSVPIIVSFLTDSRSYLSARQDPRSHADAVQRIAQIVAEDRQE